VTIVLSVGVAVSYGLVRARHRPDCRPPRSVDSRVCLLLLPHHTRAPQNHSNRATNPSAPQKIYKNNASVSVTQSVSKSVSNAPNAPNGLQPSAPYQHKHYSVVLIRPAFSPEAYQKCFDPSPLYQIARDASCSQKIEFALACLN